LPVEVHYVAAAKAAKTPKTLCLGVGDERRRFVFVAG